MYRFLRALTPIAPVMAALLICSQTAYAQLPAYLPTDGLVGWWPFNGNANDESGNGNNGVVNGATLTEDRYGNANAAFFFDNSSSISIANSPSLNNLNEITFNCFINSSSFSLSEDYLISRWENNNYNSRFWGFRANANGQPYIHPWAEFSINSSYNTCGFASQNTSLQTNEVIMMTCSYGNNNLKIYMDGQLVHTCNAIGSLTQTTSNMLFGHDGYDGFFHGVIDDIGIWNRALTQEEITSLYTGEPINPPAACNPLPSGLQNGLVGYWPFCGNANDESGNGNDGVVNGAALTDDRFGNSASAYNFDGINDLIRIENTLLEGGPQSFTISYWYNKSTNTEVAQAVFNDRTANGYKYFANFANNNQFNGAQGGVANFSNETSSYVLSNSGATQHDGNWNCISWVLDTEASIMSIYRNGGLENTVTFNPSSWVTQQAPTLIGASENFPGDEQFFNGKLDDIAMWNRALSPAEIQELFTLDACAFTVYDTAIVNVYDTLTVYNNIDVYDTLTVYDNIDVYDTLTVYNTIDVYDTLTVYNNIDIYDTLTVYNNIDVYDTLTVYNTIDVYDTLTIYNTIDIYDTLAVYNTIDVYDTTYTSIPVYDTLTVYNTIDLYDTTYVTVYDTLYTSVFDTTYVTIYDTLYTSVTDTLIIDITLVGIPEPDNHNNVLIYPNPASDHITIDYGNFANMAGYQLTITNALGQTVFNTNINAQQSYIDINSWGALGIYYVTISDTTGNPVAVKKIVLE